MIDKELIINKEDYIKNNLINNLKTILAETNNNNIDSNILEIKNIIEEFNIISESNFNIEENIIDDKDIIQLEETLKNKKSYNLENTSFYNLSPFINNKLITIGAESSVGKTAFSTQLALNLLENNNDTILAFFSLDDSKTFLLTKMINYLLSKHNIEYDVSNIKKYKNTFLKLIYSKRIAIFENIHIYSLYSELLKFINNAKENIKNPRLIVVIDYLQIIDHESYNLREGLNKICKDLKNIQKKLDCMMIILSQFNRLPIINTIQTNNNNNKENIKENTTNTLSRYRETSEIENISDICINLEAVRNKKYNTRLYIVKNKSGEKDLIFTSTREKYTFSTFIEIDRNTKKLDFNKKEYYNNIDNTNNKNDIEDTIF